ncbi:hypothetical protein QOT17_015142 [Balamuthia mandrillaris]
MICYFHPFHNNLSSTRHVRTFSTSFARMFLFKANNLTTDKAKTEAQQQSCYVLPPTAAKDLSFLIESKALNFYQRKEVFLEENGTQLGQVFNLKAKNLFGLPTFELLDLQGRQVMAAACCSSITSSSWTWTVLKEAQPTATITATRVTLGTCSWKVDFPQHSQPTKSIQQGDDDEAAESQQPHPTSLTVEGTSVLTINNPIMRGSQEVSKLKRLRLDNLGTAQFGLEVKAGENVWFMLLLSALIASMADMLKRELIKRK